MQEYKVDKTINIKYKYSSIKKSKKFNTHTKTKVTSISRWPLRFGIQILESAYIYPEQLETLRRILKKIFQRKKKLFRVCIFPDKPITRKSKSARMGRGKGSLKGYVFKARKGLVIIEFYSFLDTYATKKVLGNLVSKLPTQCCIKVLPHSFYRPDWKEYY